MLSEAAPPASLVFDSVVFDLDGTLWDTCEACAVAWNNVLRRHAIEFRTIEADDVRRVTGKSHDDCIKITFQGLPPDQVEILIEETQTEDTKIIAELGGELYPGLADGLRELKDRYPLFIVSNCQAGYIETFLDFSGLHDLFVDFECFGNTRATKAANLRRVIERNGLGSPIMVGDADGDETAAQTCGIPFLYAEYGFGHCAQPDYRCGSFQEVVRLLLD